MLRSLLMACVLVVVPLHGYANPTAETEEMDFLDLVDGEGNVLIQARGVNALTPKPGPKAWLFQLWGTGLLRGTAL